MAATAAQMGIAPRGTTRGVLRIGELMRVGAGRTPRRTRREEAIGPPGG